MHSVTSMVMARNTSNLTSRALIQLLTKHGVKHVVASPGSRNTPLLLALKACDELITTVIVDERVAAFYALGLSTVSSEPVAIVCTSGTALLNYAPAVAEAYYRKVPLIVISADRPMEWIDQDDSQTLRQFEALGNFVKNSYDLPSATSSDMPWYANRMINDALLTALKAPCGPVHINVQIAEPIGATAEIEDEPHRVIGMVTPREDLTVSESRTLGERLASPVKVMIVAGFMAPDSVLNKALNKIAELPNFIILTETIANLHGNEFITDIDATLSAMSETQQSELAPDIVITTGGALVSRFIKQYLRSVKPREHWHIGKSLTTIDCFRSLTTRVEMLPAVFFQQLASAMQPHREHSDYRRAWQIARDGARSVHQAFVSKSPWCDLKAFATFMPMIPRNYNLQFSNGTPVRYAQLFTMRTYHRCGCNRGVSGIDGSTSTALGASAVYKAPTLLITGDMSAQYDVGALGSGMLTPRFKMIVMMNGGGGIFHFIKSTRDLNIVGPCFDKPCFFPAQKLAAAYDMAYFAADSEESLRNIFPEFLSENSKPAMLAVFTDSELSGQILKEYFNQKHS